MATEAKTRIRFRHQKYPYHYNTDIKSAVEWLIQKIDDYCIGRPSIAVKNDNTIYTVVDLIKETFPDLNPSATLN
jgi:hypothetical protein